MNRLRAEISSDEMIFPLSAVGIKNLHGEITDVMTSKHVFTFHVVTVRNSSNLFLNLEVPDLSRLRVNGHKVTLS